MNHVKYLRAGPAEMPFQNWYTANTNHFRLTDSVRINSKRQLGWVINIVGNINDWLGRAGGIHCTKHSIEFVYVGTNHLFSSNPNVILTSLRPALGHKQICYTTANPTWGDVFECCFQAQSSKLQRLFSSKHGKRDVRASSSELWKMTPQVGLAVHVLGNKI